jgi:hypothetical protein
MRLNEQVLYSWRLSSAQCECYECVVELVLFYIGGWVACQTVWYRVLTIGL